MKTSARFIDVDEYIQHKYNSTISQIFENEGEDFFRQIEASTFSEIINNNENVIISTGGGTPLNQTVIIFLRKIKSYFRCSRYFI